MCIGSLTLNVNASILVFGTIFFYIYKFILHLQVLNGCCVLEEENS